MDDMIDLDFPGCRRLFNECEETKITEPTNFAEELSCYFKFWEGTTKVEFVTKLNAREDTIRGDRKKLKRILDNLKQYVHDEGIGDRNGLPLS